jgi:DNA-directed RNA polymerase specialized sigma24 family protein
LKKTVFEMSSLSEEKRVITKEDFDAMLAWLGPQGKQQAGEKYEEIRRRLIQILARRGCREAEELADEAINRVCKKAKTIARDYQGDPAVYFYGVAHKVYLETFKKKKTPLVPPPPPDAGDDAERRQGCLDHCLGQQSPANRELILQYYEGEKQAKIEHRQRLADLHGVELKVLRVRVHRIKSGLRKCMDECLGRDTGF